MNREGSMHTFCITLWEARSNRTLNSRGAGVLSRELARMVAEEVQACETYDPQLDHRKAWAEDVLRGVMRGERVPKAAPGVEEAVHVLLFGGMQVEETRDGKVLAAGGDR